MKSTRKMLVALCAFYCIWQIMGLMPLFAQSASWKWIAYGDTRSNDLRHREVLQAIVNNTPDYKFIINVGDVVQDGTNVSQWKIWQKACDDVLGGTGQDQIPPKYMAAPGNHDNTEKSAGLANWNTYLSGQKEQFGHNGKYFVFDYENARFIILDSDKSPKNGEQYSMLMDAIENNPKTWLFAIWHHPIFDFGPKRYEDYIHDLWGVPLYEAGCDIIFTGHAHYYVRTKKLQLNGDKHPPLDPTRGTVQIVTGNGGAPLYPVNPNNDGNGYMVEAYKYDYGYCELTVTNDTLRLRQILRDGSVFDEAYYTPNEKTSAVVINWSGMERPISGFRLFQNFPNPFNPMTTIRYYLPKASQTTITIYDPLGRRVQMLWEGYQLAGTHELKWLAVDENGRPRPSGVYICYLQANGVTLARKMIITR